MNITDDMKQSRHKILYTIQQLTLRIKLDEYFKPISPIKQSFETEISAENLLRKFKTHLRNTYLQSSVKLKIQF